MPTAAPAALRDAWTSADAYEAYIGRWSRRLAPRFLKWAGVKGGVDALDVGCGSGALSAALLDSGAARVVGVDLAPAYAAMCQKRLGPAGGAFAVADAQVLPLPTDSFDAAVSGLVLNFVPRPGQALTEMSRVVRAGGTVAAYVWDYAGGMEMLRRFWDEAARLDPAASALDEAGRFPLCQDGALRAAFVAASLERVEAVALDEPTVFASFEDFWEPFLGAQGPAPTYVASLRPPARARLREALRTSLPAADDGSIRLVARAWAVRGRAH